MIGVITERVVAQIVVRSIIGEVTKMLTKDVYIRVVGNNINGRTHP